MNPAEVAAVLKYLSALAESRRNVNREIDGIVLALRSPDLAGGCAASWQELGDALGVSKQAVWRAYRAID